MSDDVTSIDERRNIDEDFAKLRRIMEDESFRKGSGLAGEQAFYIYDYPPEQELEVIEHIPTLVSQLQTMTPQRAGDFAPKVLILDLYDIIIEALQQRKVLDKVLDIEARRHQIVSSNVREDKFLSLLNNMLGADAKQVPDLISRHYEEARSQGNADILFITGVGKVYPYVRAHTLLNTLQGRIDDCPLVLFYPGVYASRSVSGSTMTLFGCLPEDNYYRARDLMEMSA
ncbi:hypothetical protein BLEM_1764 [Bifidobacterium lemurum]|uniref:DUF1788 domain-containing protein n=1 Tax=Bifidobacterium lemurum TaxID=1603886 RepID=A0A261FN81_9BIFI|nr:DUF1788 domain-containing protein [Bifidobacterium lemurum]OZG60568.1 hypothetical protein BLEM_1764 [Bifidobacterium lemurum]QOL34205.1 DUF1788 domain-containing protein [Bifidobacterium lemurum]